MKSNSIYLSQKIWPFSLPRLVFLMLITGTHRQWDTQNHLRVSFKNSFFDFLGPYPRSKSEYVDTFVKLDQLSKFPFFKPFRWDENLSRSSRNTMNMNINCEIYNSNLRRLYLHVLSLKLGYWVQTETVSRLSIRSWEVHRERFYRNKCHFWGQWQHTPRQDRHSYPTADRLL